MSETPAVTAAPAANSETKLTHVGEASQSTEPAEAPERTEPTTAMPTVSSEPETSATTATSTSQAGTTAVSGPGQDSTASPTTAIPSKDDTNPLDFDGDVQTNNNLPSQETIHKLEKYTVLDESGKSHTFKSLYTGPNVARRVLIIFIRHFFCGNCQEYLRQLSAAIPPESLLQLPVSTSIAVVGCGSHKLIQAYLQETNCPYPVYADNTQHLYKELGMIRTLSAGDKPAYMKNKNMAQTVFSGILQGLKQVKSGLVLQMGDQKQVGGEFLFEPSSLSIESPIATPQSESKEPPMDLDGRDNDHEGEKSEDKKITWCHRMRNTRDHVEIPELMDVLGLTEADKADYTGSQRSSGKADKHEEKWAKAVRTRKGTGLSMASQMSRMSIDANRQKMDGQPGPEANGVSG